VGADVTEVSKRDIEDYLSKRLAEVGASTAAIRFRLLRAFFVWAVGEEIIGISRMKI
jgi:hypothetical protein